MRKEHYSRSLKKATNLSIRGDLLAEAKRFNINLSATMEEALEKQVAKCLRDEWLKQNAESLDACNTLTEKHGLFSDSYRVF